MELDKHIPSTSAWLGQLGRQLANYFPSRQAVEMLTDYAGHFTVGLERGESETALLEAMGPPEAAADALVRENWPILPVRRFWQGVLAASVLLYGGILLSCFRKGACGAWLLALPVLAVGALALFGSLRGRARAEIEGAFPCAGPPLLLRLLPAAAVMGMGLIALYWFSPAAELLVHKPNAFAVYSAEGRLLMTALAVLLWLTAGLLVWCVLRSGTASVRYLPCAVHTAGALLSEVQLYDAMVNTKWSVMFPLARYSASLSPLAYLTGAAAAAGLAVYIHRCMKRGAAWK